MIDISDAVVATVVVVELLPPVPVPPFVSLVAPLVAVTVTEPGAVGVPDTEHEMLEPEAMVAGGVGVHVPSVTPGGRPLTAHVAEIALAGPAFEHVTVPL